MPRDPQPQLPGHALPPPIQWVPLGTLTVYHITEHELDQLEKGTPESTYFGFGIFLLSTGISFLTSLLTTDIKAIRVFSVFAVVASVGIIGGILLLTVWARFQRSAKRITKIIRDRKPPDGQQQA
ncbi:MAG: hypothetical protein ABIP85_20615 [Chthoniobacteraceae bacterium]